jgi:energy-coupling factor transporter ATP-binding protein EcfA2
VRIARLDVENFRSLECASIEFDRLTAIVGRNGAGKSTALSALALFYNLAAQLTEHDYFDCDTRRTIKIRVTYKSLTLLEQQEFSSYVSDGSLTVSKVVSVGGASYKGVRQQVPEFASIRAKPFREQQAELKELIAARRYQGLVGSPRSQADLNALLDGFEQQNRTLLQPIESDTQFLGPTNIGGGKLDKFTKFVRIPAVRDAAGELDRKGAILQLIDVLVLRSVNARPEVRALNEELERRVREIFSRQNLTELDRIASDVSTLLARYAPGAALELDFAGIQAPKVPTPQPIASLVEDQFKCPINYSGHGLQRALIFALLEHLANMEATMEQYREGGNIQVGDGQAAARPEDAVAPDLILAIEEPELYLHPPRNRFLARTLRDLSRDDEGPSTQICYTTHSPFFVGLDRFDQIRLARKVATEGTRTRKSVYSSYSRKLAAADLQRVVGDPEAVFTAETFYVRSLPVMTSTVSEGFFADVAVVVEGLSDVAALMTLQELVNEKWDEKGIVVIPALGKANIDRPVLIFRGLNIPTYFVFDGDSDTRDRENTIRLNARLQRLANAHEVDFPQTQVNATWAAFSTNLEAELKSVDQTFFVDTRVSLAREFGFERAAESLKNPEMTALYVRRAHERTILPPILYDLVHAISRLVPGP